MRRKPNFLHRTMREHLQRESSFAGLVERFQTDDGLIPCECLLIREWAQGYDLVFADDPDIEVFPVPEASSVTDVLVNRPELWRQAAIRLTYRPSIFGSAPVFGVSFRQAVEIAKKAGYTKSKYFLPESYREGKYHSLLLHLHEVDDRRGKLIQLEAWQHCPGSNSAHYLHAMSPDFASQVVHLDGALIQYSDSELDKLLVETTKVKGTSYKKFFRLDGSISIGDMHTLAIAFLPGEELYSEALGVTVLPSDA